MDLYGLEQAPREWNHTLVLFHTEQQGFTRLYSESSVFYKGVRDESIVISVHVDDQTIIGWSLHLVIAVKLALTRGFEIADLEETTYTLGLEVQLDSALGRHLLSQKKFITTILERFSKYFPPH